MSIFVLMIHLWNGNQPDECNIVINVFFLSFVFYGIPVLSCQGHDIILWCLLGMGLLVQE